MDVIRREIEKVDLKSPIYIEGLPGVGYVGKLVVDHLIKELHANILQNGTKSEVRL